MEQIISFLLENIDKIYLFIIPIAYYLTEGLKGTKKLGGINTILTACGIGAFFGILLSFIGSINFRNVILGLVYGIVLGACSVTIDNIKNLISKKEE